MLHTVHSCDYDMPYAQEQTDLPGVNHLDLPVPAVPNICISSAVPETCMQSAQLDGSSTCLAKV